MFERLRERLRGRPKAEPAPPLPPATPPERSQIRPTATPTTAAAPPPPRPAAIGANTPATSTTRKEIRIDGRRYALDALPEEVTKLLADLQRAERVIQLRRDKIRLLRLGRQQLAERLRQGLTTVPERTEGTEKPAPTWTAQVSTG